MGGILIFAHTPPPHHGQSYMTQLLVDGVRNVPGFHHVDARLSEGVEEIGRPRLGKVLKLLGYCAQVWWRRWRYGLTVLYYIPAPDLRAAIYRDWLVMAGCRWMFRKVVYHHHALGLGGWIEDRARPWERRVSRALLCRPDVSIVLGEWNEQEVRPLRPRSIVRVPNGIPDPCPDFAQRLLPARVARLAEVSNRVTAAPSAGGADPVRLLFLGLCCREKGLFDAMEAARLLAVKLSRNGGNGRVRLDVAGKFWRTEEEREFRAQSSRWASEHPALELVYHGFVSGPRKRELFEACDCFCFPTYYWAESFGLVLLEAMAFGVPCVTTRYRSLPEVLPAGYAGLVPAQSPEAVAEAAERVMRPETAPVLRARFEAEFQVDRWTRRMREVLEAAAAD